MSADEKEWLRKIEDKLDRVIECRALQVEKCAGRFARLEVYTFVLSAAIGAFLSWYFLK